MFIEKIRELKKGSGEEKGLMDLEKECNAIVLQNDLLQQQDRITSIFNGLNLYRALASDSMAYDEKINAMDESIRQQLQRIDSSWCTSHIREFGNVILHRDKIAGFRQKWEDLDRKKIKLETEEATLASSRPKLNIPAIAITISAALLILSIVFLLYQQYIPSGALALIAVIIFWRREKYGDKEDPLNRVRQNLKTLLEKDAPDWQKEYQTYLASELRIQGCLSTDAVLDILNNIDSIKKEIVKQDELRATQDNETIPSILAYEKEAVLLKPFLDEKETADTPQEWVHLVKTKFESAKRDADRKTQLEELIRQKNHLLERAEKSLRETQTDKDQLLAGIAADDRPAYRKKYADNEQVILLDEIKSRAIQTIEKIAGINTFVEVSEFLSTHDKKELEEKIITLDAEVRLLETKSQENSTSIGGKRAERDRIEGESALAMHLTEQEMLKERINQEYRTWAAGKIALKILAELKTKYEKEKQPAVIKSSGKYFSAMTSGKYGRIHVSLDEKSVSVYDALEAGKRIEQLSRGTKEQLLISLRLGFIEQYETQSEPLPVIVDEIFVNFDPDRLMETARLLHAFAQTRQVLIFTCHPSTRDYFEGMEINAIDL